MPDWKGRTYWIVFVAGLVWTLRLFSSHSKTGCMTLASTHPVCGNLAMSGLWISALAFLIMPILLLIFHYSRIPRSWQQYAMAVLLIFFLGLVRQWNLHAREMEPLDVLSDLLDAENAYRSKFGHFTMSLKDLGFTWDQPYIKIFFETSQIPESFRKYVPNEAFPTTSPERFLILAVLHEEANQVVRFYTVANDGKFAAVGMVPESGLFKDISN